MYITIARSSYSILLMAIGKCAVVSSPHSVCTLQNTENKMLFMQIMQNCPTLRRRKDSNLRSSFPDNILAGCSFKPLRHASVFQNSLKAYQSGLFLSNVVCERSIFQTWFFKSYLIKALLVLSVIFCYNVLEFGSTKSFILF